MRYWPIVVLVAWISACASPYGIYHEVLPGENLYRISKAYNIDPQELAEINGIEDETQIRAGQRIFVPGARSQKSVRGGKPQESRPGKREGQREISRENTVQTFHGSFSWPIQGRVTSRFGARNGTIHDGIDISAPKGTLIRAAASGRVIYADNGIRGYGNMIIIKHEGVYSSVYAHNEENTVERNQFVEKGEVIGRVGKTGRATAPHLHFELRKGRKSVNPLFYLPK